VLSFRFCRLGFRFTRIEDACSNTKNPLVERRADDY
jgi:hypothetical protein